ncbi:MAG: NPCBM/NEW2 domain-containing protein [Pirellulaceae bacterium]
MNLMFSLLLMCLAAEQSDSAGSPVLQPETGVLTLPSGTHLLNVSLQCPEVRLNSEAGPFGGDAPTKVARRAGSVDGWACSYSPVRLADDSLLERELCLQWYPSERVLRKWLRLRLTRESMPVTVEEITLETLPANQLRGEFRPGPPQSYPLFLEGYFAGVEFPVASTRIERDKAYLGHRPRCQLEPDKWYESRRAVYGPAPAGDEVLTFHRYIEGHRPPPKGMHFNYNSWWTSPVPFTEADILGLMKQFEEKLYTRHGVALDSFTIDLGWSNPQGVWDIDRKLFPDEFSKIQAGAEAMGSRLGLWTSPSACYPQAVDPQWAVDHGYEKGDGKMLSLAGEKYRTKYGATIADYAQRFRLAQIKLDGLSLGGPDFMAGDWPSEAVAAGAVEAFQCMREASPDAWLEATYSAYASPWWLFDVNSVIGCFGDDSPYGRVPCPVYRESYTTARDYFNLQGADRLPSPIPAQEILGVIHQSNDSFMNDAVTTVLRGHAFISLYVNPKYMNDERWAMLAGLINWSRQNAELLTAPSTQPLRPATWLRDGAPWLSHEAPMPREPYGYAHWGADRGLVLLRNPWVLKQSYTLTIGALNSQVAAHAISVYPEPRVYAQSLAAGQTVEIALAPYETIVLSIAPGDIPTGIPAAQTADSPTLAESLLNPQATLRRVIYESPDERFGDNYSSLAPASGQAIEMEAQFQLQRSDAAKRLHVLALLEGKTVPEASGVLTVDGQEVALHSARSDAGFFATVATGPDSWHFLEGTLPPAGRSVSLRVTTEDPTATLSIWLWEDRPGQFQSHVPNALPAPEWVSLDSACVLSPTPLASVSDELRRPTPVERIEGIFLDALQPLKVAQDFGTLQKNRSVWEKPLIIGEQHFRRGVGTHANSEIVYQLDGKYGRFQAWAGPDMATFGTMCFSVVVDGQERWRSGKMARGDAPQRVDVDVTGAKELRLLVNDAGDNIMGDHADWADARLLR